MSDRAQQRPPTPTDDTAGVAAAPARIAEPRQRWRVAYRRAAAAPGLDQRAQLAAWESALIASGLPVVCTDTSGARPRIVHAAQLPVGVPAERELLDLFLTERRTLADVRSRLAPVFPADHALVDLHDVWLGAPTLPGQVRGAVYRVTVEGASRTAIAEGIRWILAAEQLPRSRERARGTLAYDLRPLLAGCRIVDALPPAGAPATATTTIELVVRMDPELGTGRPDEVIAAIAAAAASPDLVIAGMVRQALLLAGDRLLES